MGTDLEIADEKALARMLVHKWQLGIGEWFGRVTQIPRGKRINPDIDLLRVYSATNRDETVGYELKVLRYNSLTKSIPLTPFYTGIGEVLCYFDNGIDRAELVLGFHPSCGEEAREVQRRLKRLCDFLVRYMPIFRQNLVVSYVGDGQRNYIHYTHDWERAVFSHDEESRHKRDCLLRHEFAYEEKFR